MDKAVNVIEQVIKSIDKTGLLFIVIAIVVGIFKQTWLLAGVNTMPKKELAKIDLNYLRKWFGIFFGVWGSVIILSKYIFNFFNVICYHHHFKSISTLSFIVFIILYFNVIKRKRIYNKQDTSQAQPMEVTKNKWRIFISIAIVAPVGLLIYFGYKEPKVQADANALKLKGLYGINLPFTEIAEADTIVWSKMPAISIRTNGISLNKVNRGKFRTVDGKKVHLSIHRGVSPVIRIATKDGSVYYINRKNATETRKIYNTYLKQ